MQTQIGHIFCRWCRPAEHIQEETRQLRTSKHSYHILKIKRFSVDKDSLVRFIRSRGKDRLRIIVGTSDFYITDPQALVSLTRIANVRSINNKGFHPKLICLEGETGVTLIVGSSNLSAPALGSGNLEANVLVVGRKNESPIFKQAIDFFEKTRARSRLLSEKELRLYEYNWKTVHEDSSDEKRKLRPRNVDWLVEKTPRTLSLQKQHTLKQPLWKIAPGSHPPHYFAVNCVH